MHPVRTFALIMGIVFVLVGVMGFLPAPFVTTPHDMHGVTVHANHGYLLGLFPVNLLHNLVHILFGIAGIMSYRSGPGASRMFARFVAVAYAVLAVFGLIPHLDTVFGLIPIHGNDVWLHALIAAAAAVFGWAPFASEPRHLSDVTGTPMPR
jgi:hypothetical protein